MALKLPLKCTLKNSLVDSRLKALLLVSRQAHATISNAVWSPIYRTSKRARKCFENGAKNRVKRASKIALKIETIQH